MLFFLKNFKDIVFLCVLIDKIVLQFAPVVTVVYGHNSGSQQSGA